MEILVIKPIGLNDFTLALALDRICLGGLWGKDAYLREISSPNSTLLGLWLHTGNKHQADAKDKVHPKNQNFHLSEPWIKTERPPKLIGIGCLWSIVEEAHITLLGIHPNYQKQGLGQLLLLTLLQDGVARQLKWATLEVNANNLAAISLYQKFGFALAGKRKGYYQKTGEDALIFWCKGLDKLEFQQKLNLWQKQARERLSPNYHIDDIN